jgi:hypothetical protein
MINNMTERLDEAKKYIELFKMSASRSKEADTYWSTALDILKVVDATVKKEEVGELELLENKMMSAFYDSIERSEYKGRNHYFY